MDLETWRTALHRGRDVTMKNKMRHYFQVYFQFISTSYSVSTSFRTSFVLLILMDLFFYLSSIATVEMIFGHVNVIGGWSRPEFLFFIAYMLTIDQLHMVFVSENFWELSEKIRTGQMDYILLKPLHSIFTSFFRNVRISSMLNAPVVWGLLIYYGSQCHLTWLTWATLPFTIILSFLVLILSEFIISTFMFWIVAGVGINFLRMQMQSLSRWPDYIYGPFSRRIMTLFIPILLIGTPSVTYLLDNSKWTKLIPVIIAIFILRAVLMKMWKIALTQYNSASS